MYLSYSAGVILKYYESILNMVVLKFQIRRRREPPRLNFRNRDELRIDYDVESSFGRGGLHFGSPATRFVCCHLIR